jgi:uncharacterized protein
LKGFENSIHYDSPVQSWTIPAIAAAIWAAIPLLAFGLAGDRIAAFCGRLTLTLRLALPVVFSLPYVLAAQVRVSWLTLYFLLPVVVAVILWQARRADPVQKGNWRDFFILILLGLAVDLRWFEPAWPAQLRALNKLVLLDSGLYGFIAIRQLSNVGFDLKVRGKDLRTGFRELVFYAPIAVPLGLALGFLHFRPHMPSFPLTFGTWLITFFAIAIPEEIYFRGWMQNLIERRCGRHAALLTTAAVFGLSHFNRRAVHFNWRYVLLAAIAGVFYGRAWRQDRRVAPSAITHSLVDAIWSLWL